GAVGYVYNGSGIEGRPDWSIGFVYLPALAGIVLVSVLTAPLGVRLAHALPVDKLKKVFAVLLYVVAIRMLFSLF
ncbi:MAG TPA: TSUP family transporter, partial [Polyangiaceae bacterium]|nr:TSUP family transporter [Polyangiaceae bacterium]